MIKTVRDAWKIPELRNKILFTIFALLIFRLGAAIPVPYINADQLETYLSAQSGTILGLMNAMSGSAFSMATPVSYTHLDVYKRQGRLCVWPATSCPSSARS